MALALTDLSDVEAFLARQPPVNVPYPELVDDFAEGLSHVSDQLTATFAAVCGYKLVDAAVLWEDQQSYLQHLVSLPDRPPARRVSGSRARVQYVESVAVNRMLVCLPSNAPIPLVAVLAACAAKSGSVVVFTRPQRVARIVDSVTEQLPDVLPVGVFQGSPRDILRSPILRYFRTVYFMGASSAYQDVASACAGAGVNLIFEGQGNGLAVIGASAGQDLGVAVDMLIRAKSFCNGQMCSAPNGLLVHESLAERLLDEWDGTTVRHLLAAPLGELVHSPQWEQLVAQGRLAGAGVDWRVAQSPNLAFVDQSLVPVDEEFFAPVAWMTTYSDFEYVVRTAAAQPFRLQISYFGHDERELGLLRALGFARVCVNIDPADQDPLAPWGNFAMSGYSAVRTFFDKFFESVLVEGSL